MGERPRLLLVPTDHNAANSGSRIATVHHLDTAHNLSFHLISKARDMPELPLNTRLSKYLRNKRISLLLKTGCRILPH
jgi:hypothetical protein